MYSVPFENGIIRETEGSKSLISELITDFLEFFNKISKSVRYISQTGDHHYFFFHFM